MEPLPNRKHLSHQVPAHLPGNSEGEIYFITICCTPRGENQLALPQAWQAIEETIAYRESAGHLKTRLILAMPDHLHGLFSFDGGKAMAKVVADMKSWLARRHGIRWQRDFFDHRLRSWESAEEKGAYIRKNPVRAGLIAEGEKWPYLVDRRAPEP